MFLVDRPFKLLLDLQKKIRNSFQPNSKEQSYNETPFRIPKNANHAWELNGRTIWVQVLDQRSGKTHQTKSTTVHNCALEENWTWLLKCNKAFYNMICSWETVNVAINYAVCLLDIFKQSGSSPQHQKSSLSLFIHGEQTEGTTYTKHKSVSGVSLILFQLFYVYLLIFTISTAITNEVWHTQVAKNKKLKLKSNEYMTT